MAQREEEETDHQPADGKGRDQEIQPLRSLPPSPRLLFYSA